MIENERVGLTETMADVHSSYWSWCVW